MDLPALMFCAKEACSFLKERTEGLLPIGFQGRRAPGTPWAKSFCFFFFRKRRLLLSYLK